MLCLQQLRRLEELTLVRLRHDAVRGPGWAFIPGMASLRELVLSDVRLADWKHMLPLPPQLTKLSWCPDSANKSSVQRLFATVQELGRHFACVQLLDGELY
jgi:hypothetical protein